jgi:hypothetical protein
MSSWCKMCLDIQQNKKTNIFYDKEDWSKKNILKPCPFKCVRDLKGVREENTWIRIQDRNTPNFPLGTVT